MKGDFFIWCSGADKKILEECPTERTKFVGIGATIFLTAVLASISGGYAIFFTFNSFFISFVFGVLWGFIIFNLDRYIVSSIKKSGKFKNEFLTALPRLLIAIVLAITISKPLEIKLFDGSITKKMGEIEDTYNKKGETDFNDRRATLDKTKSDLEAELESKRNSIYLNDPIYKDFQEQKNEQETNINDWTSRINNNSAIINQNSWIDEIFIPETGGTRKIRRYNQIAKNKISENKKLNSDIASSKSKIVVIADSIQNRKGNLANQVKAAESQYGSQIAGVQKQIEDLNSQRPEILAKVKSDAALDKDVLSRLRALSQLKSPGNSVWWASLLITLLFVLLECAPITVKLLSKRGPYDEILDRIEYEIYLDQQKIISDRNDEINNLIVEIQALNKLKGEVRIKTEKAKLDAELIANEALLNEIAKKQANLANIAIEKWYNDELSKLKGDGTYQYAKTGQSTTPTLEDKLWKVTNSQDEVFYLFKNGQPSSNELIYIKNGKTHTGNWEYLNGNATITLNILSNAEIYTIESVTKDSAKLKSATNFYLELAKV